MNEDKLNNENSLKSKGSSNQNKMTLPPPEKKNRFLKFLEGRNRK